LTGFLYVLIALHALVLILAAPTAMPGFLSPLDAGCDVVERNPYDRVGHFMQGFVLRLSRANLHSHGLCDRQTDGRILSVCVAMTISASYELIEWAAAVSLGQGADEFLGTQGDRGTRNPTCSCADRRLRRGLAFFAPSRPAIGRLSPATGRLALSGAES